MKRAAILCGMTFPLLAVGCLPYAYPKLDYVPAPARVGAKSPQVSAYRVDVTTHQADVGETAEWTLTEIKCDRDGRIPPQARLSVTRGFYVLGIALNYNVGHSHATYVRLYRPGFHTVELQAWESAESIPWEPAVGVAAEEKAIDDLVRPPKGCGKREPVDGDSDQASALRFAAQEYARLACMSDDPGTAARLNRKASEVRLLFGGGQIGAR